ncbi:hypothetical protein [Pseudomonas fluorescens]|uniref:Uncharacterized protein n=1 Tax=Pseudomonas fluorescens TaxID=294 RepID=A0A0F4TPW7_PSEFL|nr:hypothetical protein [Pseudomonas fluorescens]KJZ46471.1 hypothetical protein VC34_07105 [Pseudomonas fluorescens]
MKLSLPSDYASVVSESTKASGTIKGKTHTGSELNFTSGIKFAKGEESSDGSTYAGLIMAVTPEEDAIVFSFPHGLEDGRHLVKYADFTEDYSNFWSWSFGDKGTYENAYSGELNITLSKSGNAAAGTLTFYSIGRKMIFEGSFDVQK